MEITELIIFFILGFIAMYFWQKRKKKSINTSEVFAESISDELTDQIKKLADLRDTGLLTEEEFALKKKQLLGI
ncbi:hypothetical protein PALU110988_27400 [Paenibacillus lupini]|nr:hypothetical protein [Paenibacillus lupini]